MSCRYKEPKEKLCNGCGNIYPIDDYNLRANGRGGYKRRSRCRKCECEWQKRYQKDYPEEMRERKKRYKEKDPERYYKLSRKHALRSSWKRYGHDPDKVERYFESHSGYCEICGIKPTKGAGRLHIDHDHDTGEIRGMLCLKCNTGLGQFNDDVKTLKSAIKYLKKNHTGIMPD